MTQSNKIRVFFSWFFPTLFTLLLLPPHFFNQPKPGIDESWNIALHLAYRYHLGFGKDFAFTFGPLGILHSRLPISIHPLVYLLFDLYFLASLFFLLRRIFRDRLHAGTVLFVLFTTGLIMGKEGLEDWFFFLCLFYLFCFLREPSGWVCLAQAALLAMFSFYFKLNMGVAGIFALLAVLGYCVVRKRIKPVRALLYLALFLALFFLGAFCLNVSLAGYLRSGMQLIKDYSDAMLWPVKGDYRMILQSALVVLAFVALFMGVRLWTLVRRRDLLQNMDELFIQAVICLAFFLYFKSSFVRADGHVYQFFRAAPILIGLLFIFAVPGVSRTIAGIGCWAILALSVATASLDYPAGRLYQHILTLSFLPQKVSDAREYIHEVSAYRAEAMRLDSETRVPSAMKVKIGGRSVDIMPWEISKIYFNGLNYSPRPVVQSYAAYNRYLDSLNATRYYSAKAPDVIFFSLQSIDRRFPWFDEALTKLAIIDRYRPAGYLDGELLLEKDPTLHRLIRDREENAEVKLNEDIIIGRSDGLRFSRFFIDYGVRGKIDRLLLVPPALNILLTLEDGDTIRYSAIKPIFEDGIIVNKYVENKEDFQLLLQGAGKLTPNIKKIRIEPDSANKSVRPSIRMVTTYYRWNDRTTIEQGTDSAAIQSLYYRLRPVSLDSASLTTGALRYSLKTFTTFSPIIRVSGALNPGHPASSGVITTAILRSKDHLFGMQTKVDGTDFSAAVARDLLPTGDYRLGLMQWRPGEVKRTVRYSDLHLLVRNAYTIEDLGASGSALKTDTGLVSYIEGARGSGDSIHISGWSYLRGVDPAEPTFVILKGNRNYRISTDITERADVAKVLNISSDYCGFDVLLTGSGVAKGQYLIGLERFDRRSRKRVVRFPGATINVGFTELFTLAPIAPAGVEDSFPSGVDHYEDGKDAIFLSGWAVRKMQDVSSSTISFVLKGKDGLYGCSVNPEQRKDVTAYFKSKYNLDNCGFSARISKAGLPKGQYQIGLRIEGPNGDTAVKFLDRYTLKE